jgi:hypothetical protein
VFNPDSICSEIVNYAENCLKFIQIIVKLTRRRLKILFFSLKSGNSIRFGNHISQSYTCLSWSAISRKSPDSLKARHFLFSDSLSRIMPPLNPRGSIFFPCCLSFLKEKKRFVYCGSTRQDVLPLRYLKYPVCQYSRGCKAS